MVAIAKQMVTSEFIIFIKSNVIIYTKFGVCLHSWSKEEVRNVFSNGSVTSLVSVHTLLPYIKHHLCMSIELAQLISYVKKQPVDSG